MDFLGFLQNDKYSASASASDTSVCDANSTLRIMSDAKRIKQVLMNLLSNSLKFTKDGGEISIVTEYV